MALKCSDFQHVFLNDLRNIKCNCMSRLFVLHICWRWVEKNVFTIVWVLTPSKPKWSKIFP